MDEDPEKRIFNNNNRFKEKYLRLQELIQIYYKYKYNDDIAKDLD